MAANNHMLNRTAAKPALPLGEASTVAAGRLRMRLFVHPHRFELYAHQAIDLSKRCAGCRGDRAAMPNERGNRSQPGKKPRMRLLKFSRPTLLPGAGREVLGLFPDGQRLADHLKQSVRRHRPLGNG